MVRKRRQSGPKLRSVTFGDRLGTGMWVTRGPGRSVEGMPLWRRGSRDAPDGDTDRGGGAAMRLTVRFGEELEGQQSDMGIEGGISHPKWGVRRIREMIRLFL